VSTAGLPPRRRGRRAPRPADSCRQCLAWGHHGGCCRACENFAAAYPSGPCRTCGRVVPVKAGACRLCHKQATLVAGPQNKTRVDLSVAAHTGQQLFFADMARAVSLAHARPDPHQHVSTAPSRPALRLATPAWWQPPLFDLPPDLRRVSSLDPPHDPDQAAVMLARAESMAELRGWNARTLGQARRGLRIIAAAHRRGEPIKATTVQQLTSMRLSALRVHEVLADLGLVIEDRPDSLGAFLDRQLDPLPAPIHAEVDVWLDVQRHGDSRRRARARSTVTTRVYLILPFLIQCADRYATLRQVTRDDITTWLADHTSRAQAASALRSLFGVLKQKKMVFADPTRSVHTGRIVATIPTPIPADDRQTTADATRENTILGVIVALAGVHALHPRQIRTLRLSDVDLPNRRLRAGSTDRPLDEHTARAVDDYLTSNPHLLVTRRSAHGTEPVSSYWLLKQLRGLPVTTQRMREDRVIEEGVATRADPLHIAAVFGVSVGTALRYATAASDTLTAATRHPEPAAGPAP
jgi:integrase